MESSLQNLWQANGSARHGPCGVHRADDIIGFYIGKGKNSTS
jgi:hypothetical protein